MMTVNITVKRYFLEGSCSINAISIERQMNLAESAKNVIMNALRAMPIVRWQ